MPTVYEGAAKGGALTLPLLKRLRRGRAARRLARSQKSAQRQAVALSPDINGVTASDFANTAEAAAIVAYTETQAMHGLRRLLPRYRAQQARLKQLREQLTKGLARMPEWIGHLDPLVSKTATFLIGVGGTTTALETFGARTSLKIWESTLGGSTWLNVLSLALGLVLAGLAHLAGGLAASAVHAKSKPRRRLLSVASGVVLAVAVVTVIALGVGRDHNIAATADLNAATAITTRATKLDRQADRLERRAGSARQGRQAELTTAQRASVAELRRKAEAQRSRAERLTDHAWQTRTLFFFLFVQAASLVVAAGLSAIYSLASPLRLRRRVVRLEADIKSTYSRMWNTVHTITARGLQSLAVAAAAVDNTGSYTPPKDLAERVFARALSEPAPVTADPTPAAITVERVTTTRDARPAPSLLRDAFTSLNQPTR